LRSVNVNVLLILAYIELEHGGSSVLGDNSFTSTYDEFDWDGDWFLEFSTVTVIAYYDSTREVS
jgi:hypothetical protein